MLKVEIIGYTGNDAVLTESKDGRLFWQFSVAHITRNQTTIWVRCISFDVENNLFKLISRGTLVRIMGDLVVSLPPSNSQSMIPFMSCMIDSFDLLHKPDNGGTYGNYQI